MNWTMFGSGFCPLCVVEADTMDEAFAKARAIYGHSNVDGAQPIPTEVER